MSRRFEITGPDGRRFEVTAPDGASQDDVLAFASQKWERRKEIERQIAGDPISQGARNFAQDMPAGEQFKAGVGKAFSDIGTGAKQIFGFGGGPSSEDVAEQRRLDKPLMGTGAGLAGNVAGNITAFAPLAVVPGSSTIAGAGAIGSTMAALQPAGSLQERMGKMAIGGALGAGTQAAGTIGAQYLGERAAARSAPLTPREQTLGAAIKEGYVVPPSAAQQPGFLTRRAESIAGKAALGQEAALRNQTVTNRLAKADAGLAPNEDITLRTLSAARDRLAGPYREVADLSPLAKNALESWREANKMAHKWQAAHERLPLPSLEAKIDRFKQSAQVAQQQMESEAIAAGKPDLVTRLREARVAIAKNYSVERALNLGSGEIDASVIGRAYDKGIPMTGGLETIAKTQQAFKPYMREGGNIPTPGVSATEAFAGPVLAMGGAAASGHPVGAIAGGLPLLRSPMRSMLLSNPMQQSLVPRTGPTMTGQLADPEVQRRLALAMRVLFPPPVAMDAARD